MRRATRVRQILRLRGAHEECRAPVLRFTNLFSRVMLRDVYATAQMMTVDPR